MPSRYELGVRGTEAIVANFHAADIDSQVAFREANRIAAQELFELATFLCPVDTGFMQEHLHLYLTDLTFDVGWDATDFFDAGHPFYPEFVEFGTRFMRGRYPLTQAWNEVYPKYIADVSRLHRAAYAKWAA